MRRSRLLAIVLAAGLGLAATAGAVEAPRAGDAPLQWQSLSDEQREALEPFRDRWDRLPSDRQRLLLRGAERWQTLTPEQRGMAREQVERFRDMPPDERQRVRERLDRLRQLPPDQQQRLRERWQQMTPAERKDMMKGRSMKPHRPDADSDASATTPDERADADEVGTEAAGEDPGSE
jgi:Protein of unknown function (DUF3106)